MKKCKKLLKKIAFELFDDSPKIKGNLNFTIHWAEFLVITDVLTMIMYISLSTGGHLWEFNPIVLFILVGFLVIYFISYCLYNILT